MKAKISMLFLVFSTIAFGQIQINSHSELYLDSIFAENEGTFALYNLNDDSYSVYNPERAEQAFPVHSTSKILWSIIALEEGIVGTSDSMKWDSVKYPRNKNFPAWANDQNITSALKYSVNWYYQELISLMTPEMINKYLINLNYQPKFKVDKLHYYGLTFNIKKSAFEQIGFLKSIYLNDYNLTTPTLSAIYDGMLYEESENHKLYLRTGLGASENDTGIGWLIGIIKNNNQVYFFALNVEDKDEQKIAELRYKYGFRILKALDLGE